MNWEQKLDAITAISHDVSLRMRSPGNWYVSASGVSVSEKCFLVGAYGNGATPEEAVLHHWEQWAAVGPNNSEHPYLVIEPLFGGPRRHVFWNGYSWRDLPVPQPVPSGERSPAP